MRYITFVLFHYHSRLKWLVNQANVAAVSGWPPLSLVTAEYDWTRVEEANKENPSRNAICSNSSKKNVNMRSTIDCDKRIDGGLHNKAYNINVTKRRKWIENCDSKRRAPPTTNDFWYVFWRNTCRKAKKSAKYTNA